MPTPRGDDHDHSVAVISPEQAISDGPSWLRFDGVMAFDAQMNYGLDRGGDGGTSFDLVLLIDGYGLEGKEDVGVSSSIRSIVSRTESFRVPGAASPGWSRNHS